jgi:N-acylneuraminate cytidylyltransferase
LSTAAIILARGGSKGIPRKNLQTVGGLSLLEWAIAACHAAEEVDAVFVSTEDAEIAAVAAKHGATVIDRPDALATDEATSADALAHSVAMLDAEYDTFVNVQCTTFPSIAADIDATVRALRDTDADSSLTVKREIDFLWRVGLDGYGFPVTQYDRKARQEATSEYAVTGAAYAIRRDIFEKTGQLPAGRVALVETSGECVDIDTPHDLAIARAIYDQRK